MNLKIKPTSDLSEDDMLLLCLHCSLKLFNNSLVPEMKYD